MQVEEYRGFPIVRTATDRMVLGYISRLELEAALGKQKDFLKLLRCLAY